MNAEFTPHPAVHQPWMFICGIDSDDTAVAYAENHSRQIASSLLEDIGDWHHAIKNLQKTAVPPPVVEALDLLHDAVCGWVDWDDERARRAPDRRPSPTTPPRPDGAA